MSRTVAVLSAVVVGVVAPLALLAPTSGATPRAAVAVVGDTDGDGFAEPADCGPLDPTVHPDAPDRPDLDFTDTDCDGIDGDRVGSVFVSLGGNDAAPGTAENPLRTVNAAVAAATTGSKDVLVAGGTYAESVNLADGIGVYGGYAPGTWQRSAAEPTTIQGAPAALAAGDVGVILQNLTLRGVQDGTGNVYALRAGPSGGPSQVLLDHVTVRANNAAAGATGGAGSTGLAGFGLPGGFGGAGACGAGPGAPGTGGGPAGTIGASGGNGLFSVPAAATWGRPVAGTGGQGTAGNGGRGGTGGSGAFGVFGSVLCGGLGGRGGSGGGGGFGGGGGQAGAGSFGVYALDSSIVAVASDLAAGNGGAGGPGGFGGNGGAGLAGLAGAFGSCDIFAICAGTGTAGLIGAPGGPGGRGGGGAGGPSAAVYQGGLTSGFTSQQATSTTPGTAGAGGAGGVGTGQSGAAAPVMRTSGAPTTSTYDFDGDGINDPADTCPADPAGTSGQAGCPTGPETTITSGPADGGFLLADRTSVGFGSSAATPSFTCSLDGGDGAGCTSPRSLTGLSGRTHVVRVWSRDGGGAADPSAAMRTFTVPRNNTALTHSRGWVRRTGSGYFLNSFSTTTRKGSSLSARVTDAQQLALVATRGRGFGKVNVMLGQTRLAQVNLAATRTRKKQLIAIPLAAPATGTVKVVVATAGKEVRIEGLGVATP